MLPLYEGPDGARLWPEGNPWWQAWEKNLDPERLLRLVLPLGDLEDMATLKVEQVQAHDQAALAALTGRYNSADALVVTAKVLQPASPADHPAANGARPPPPRPTPPRRMPLRARPRPPCS